VDCSDPRTDHLHYFWRRPRYRNVYACDVNSFFSIVGLIKQNFRAIESKVVDEDFNTSVLICCWRLFVKSISRQSCGLTGLWLASTTRARGGFSPLEYRASIERCRRIRCSTARARLLILNIHCRLLPLHTGRSFGSYMRGREVQRSIGRPPVRCTG
jgi:hypothetical protein